MHVDQAKVLAILPKLSGPLSIIGSGSILYDIFSDRTAKLKRPYYRIVLGMSLVDIVVSIWLSLSTWPIPRGTEGVYGAVGNTASCTAQGFFIQLLVMSPMYNLNLSIYYLLLSNFQLTEEKIAERYEKFMHGSAIVVGFGFAILGLPLTLYNNANLWCWIAAFPSSCEDNSGNPGDVPCERGKNAWLFRWLIFYVPIWAIILAITIIMIMMIRSVNVEERRIIEMQKEIRSRPAVNQFRGGEEAASANVPSTSGDTARSTPMPIESNRYGRSRQMFRQAMFYIAVFYLTWVFATLNRIYQLITGKSSFGLLVLHSLIGPLQGLFNFIIYRHGQIAA